MYMCTTEYTLHVLWIVGNVTKINVNIVLGEHEQMIMHDVMHAIVLYTTQSECGIAYGVLMFA